MPRGIKSTGRGRKPGPVARPVTAGVVKEPVPRATRLPSELMTQLRDLSAAQLTELIARAREMHEERTHGERQSFIEDVRSRAADLGVSIAELLGVGPRIAPRPVRGPTKKVDKRRGSPAPKFQGPNGELWTGRGRPPRWLAALEQAGHTRSDYLIHP